MDWRVIAGLGARILLSTLRSMISEVETNDSGRFDGDDNNNTVCELLKTPEDDRCHIFVRLLRFYVVESGCDYNTARHQKLCLPKSTHVLC